MLDMRKNCAKVNSPEVCNATLENLSYIESISSTCIYWLNSLKVVMSEAGLVCCANN